jgi:hypothetical protein
MLSFNNNEMAILHWDRLLLTLDNFTRRVWSPAKCGHIHLARLRMKQELKQTSLAPANDGGAHRGLKAASQTNRPRRRRRRLPDGFVTIRQLAEQADAGLSTAYLWVETGKLAASRWRGVLVVDERDVADFLAVKPLRPVAANSTDAETSNG